MDLREKLKQYHQNQVSVQPRLKRELTDWIDGKELVCESGACFHVSKFFPMNTVHGQSTLSQIQRINTAIYEQVGRDARLAKLDFSKALFIDTETTGLAGGTGTVPFLIGLGYFKEDVFCVEQFFLRDYHEEKAMLQMLADKMAMFDSLISYNGKSYDMNLIQSRFLMHRMQVPVERFSHLDLLYPVRRIWRRRLQDCSLGNIEKEILKYHRTGDVPGHLIPDLFFRYIRTGDGSELAGVFEHNQWDIISLVSIAIQLGQIHLNPVLNLNYPNDLLSHGKSLYQADAFEEAIQCLMALDKENVAPEILEESYLIASYSYKKINQWQDAVQLWQYMVEKFPHRLEGYEELAKFYEHREKNLDAAIVIVKKALVRIELLDQLHSQAKNSQYLAMFTHRLNRLNRKQQT